MHVGTDCSWLDERTDLNNVAGTIMINQQRCSCMIEHVVREWWNNKIEQRCYNHELGCCIKSGFACSNIREQPLLIRQAVYNMLKHDWTILLSILLYHVNSAVTGLSNQQPCNSTWYFYACTSSRGVANAFWLEGGGVGGVHWIARICYFYNIARILLDALWWKTGNLRETNYEKVFSVWKIETLFHFSIKPK